MEVGAGMSFDCNYFFYHPSQAVPSMSTTQEVEFCLTLGVLEYLPHFFRDRCNKLKEIDK